MHFPSHVRQALLDWIDSGFGEFATVEAGYASQRVYAEDMLRRFLVPTSCSDTVPKDYAARIAERLGYGRPVNGMSYAMAAGALLAATTAGPEAGRTFLEAALVDAMDRRLFGPPPPEWWQGLSDAERSEFMAASTNATVLSEDLAEKLRQAGVRVTWGSWSNGPWFPVWPTKILEYVARRRIGLID